MSDLPPFVAGIAQRLAPAGLHRLRANTPDSVLVAGISPADIRFWARWVGANLSLRVEGAGVRLWRVSAIRMRIAVKVDPWDGPQDGLLPVEQVVNPKAQSARKSFLTRPAR
jgi:hypothetical protein